MRLAVLPSWARFCCPAACSPLLAASVKFAVVPSPALLRWHVTVSVPCVTLVAAVDGTYAVAIPEAVTVQLIAACAAAQKPASSNARKIVRRPRLIGPLRGIRTAPTAA